MRTISSGVVRVVDVHVLHQCRPVSTPAGQPNDPGVDNTTTGNGDGNTNATGTNNRTNSSRNGATNTAASGSGPTLPKTGSGVAALGGLGLALVASGLLLVRRSRPPLVSARLTVPASRLDRRS